jgi:hypothetical protein
MLDGSLEAPQERIEIGRDALDPGGNVLEPLGSGARIGHGQHENAVTELIARARLLTQQWLPAELEVQLEHLRIQHQPSQIEVELLGEGELGGRHAPQLLEQAASPLLATVRLLQAGVRQLAQPPLDPELHAYVGIVGAVLVECAHERGKAHVSCARRAPTLSNAAISGLSDRSMKNSASTRRLPSLARR